MVRLSALSSVFTPMRASSVAQAERRSHSLTHIRNIAHLRINECDRLSACATELARIGVKTEESADSLTIYGLGPEKPSIPEGTVFQTYNDHRLAMSCSLLGLATGQAVTVDSPSVVRKSFPEFWNVWSALL